ncbi:MAG: dynamin family protein [Ruminiclostridium sp.]|nr:dynamin family protein [Ruminiclostridium sp.]
MADQNTQRIEVINRTRAQIECVKKLTDPRYYSIIGGDRTSELQIMLKKLEALCSKLERNTFDVSIVGLEKTGKSTFANAFMGIDILPTKDARCTYTATNICYGNDDKAEVKFFSKEEFNENFFVRLNSIGIQIEGLPDNWY